MDQKKSVCAFFLIVVAREVKVEALCFPTICTPLPPILEVNHYPCLRDLELADNFAETDDAIDLLVGSDYYWDLLLER